METLAPPLASLVQIRWEMENGSSFRESLRQYLSSDELTDFNSVLKEWLVRKSHDQDVSELVLSCSSAYRRALLEVFARGWDGEPILESLHELEVELHLASQEELDRFVATLPFRAMIPLMFLQFPAYLLLLLGPLIAELMRSLGHSR